MGKDGAAPTGRDPAAALSPADPQEPPTHASRSAFVASRGSRPASDGRTVRHGRALFLLAQLRRDRALHVRRFVGGLLVGAGAFQLYDGLVQHKLLGLHQIRYDVALLPYDLVWNITAGVLLVVGAALVLTTCTRQAR
ncbi:MAG TPA: DUF2243 domain-containing protein [Pseudonocardia sp.]|nr:DUF2243 domain-containing protein [Pseudonocardia sp.]